MKYSPSPFMRPRTSCPCIGNGLATWGRGCWPIHTRPTMNAKTYLFHVRLAPWSVQFCACEKNPFSSKKPAKPNSGSLWLHIFFHVCVLCSDFLIFYLRFNNMALEQLPDVVLKLWPDFTLSSINSAYKGAQKLGFLFLPRIPRIIDPKIL